MEIPVHEIIQIHIGCAGLGIVNPCWELYSLEHGFDKDGTIILEPATKADNAFYSCSDTGKITARSIMIDTEPNAIDDIRLGPYSKLFDKKNLIFGNNDSGNIYARGYYRNSKLLIEEITEVINQLTEKCSSLQGFLIFRSLGGGTGSGLGAQIMEHLDYCFPKTIKYEFVNFPSPTISPSISEVYNAVLSTHATMELSDCTFSIDNNAVHEICLNSLDMDGPNYKDLNQIIGQVIAAFTSTFRSQGEVNCKYLEINYKLVPYPILHFPLITYAPIYIGKKDTIENLSCLKLTNLLFEPKYQLLKYNQNENKCISAIILYRGNLKLTDINETIDDLKSVSLNFKKLDHLYCCLNNMTPIHSADNSLIATENDICLLSNNSGIREAWIPIIQKFNRMLKKKAFLCHYISEGLNELDFQEAEQNLCTLMDEYKDLEDKTIQFHRYYSDFTEYSFSNVY